MSLQDVREEYHAQQLTEADLLPDPLAQAKRWVDDAIAANLPMANAMTLATVAADGQPSARVVLLKQIDSQGFAFYSHYDSRKGAEINANPKVSFAMHWPALDRQLVVMGEAQRLSREVSLAYFHSRPRDSQLSAAISPQSRPVSREWLVQQMTALATRCPDGTPIPLPENWGGYCIQPHEIQFWHGRPGRLHDRFRYLKLADGSWQCQRLAP